MKTTAKKITGLLLVLVMLLPNLASVAQGVGGLEFRADYIAQFDSFAAASDYLQQNGGSYLGGGMALVTGKESELLSRAEISSLTRNETVKACALNDEKLEQQWHFTNSFFASTQLDKTFQYYDLYRACQQQAEYRTRLRQPFAV